SSVVEGDPLRFEGRTVLIAVRGLADGDDAIPPVDADGAVEQVLADARWVRADDSGDIAVRRPLPLLQQLHCFVDQRVPVGLEPAHLGALGGAELLVRSAGDLREVVGLGALREDIAALAGENPSALGLQDPSGGDHVDRAPGDADLEARDALRRPRRLVAREFDPRGDVLDDPVAWRGPSITEDPDNSSPEQGMAHPGTALRSATDRARAGLGARG